jgi:hypothetical protein
MHEMQMEGPSQDTTAGDLFDLLVRGRHVPLETSEPQPVSEDGEEPMAA